MPLIRKRNAICTSKISTVQNNSTHYQNENALNVLTCVNETGTSAFTVYIDVRYTSVYLSYSSPHIKVPVAFQLHVTFRFYESENANEMVAYYS